jgi:hypothetical protein
VSRVGWEPVSVECYAGQRYPEAPRRFRFGAEWQDVDRVERSWREPEGPHFLLSAADGSPVEVAYDERKDLWLGRRASRKRDDNS